MIADNIKSLICCIVAVLLLLSVCMTIDYADNTPVNNINSSKMEITNKSIIVANDTGNIHANGIGDIGIVEKDKRIYTVKEKKVKKVKKQTLPTISMWAKPSVRCGYPYKWYYRTFIDYCPNCHHYNCLLKNPKGVPENEYTCRYCDSDFDGVVGKEKYSWSHVYLTRA